MSADIGLVEGSAWFTKLALAASGLVVETSGDAALVAFDSASAAVTASIQMQRSAASIGHAPLRIGLATGDVEWADGGCSGPAVGTATGLLVRALPGQILVNNVVRWLAGS